MRVMGVRGGGVAFAVDKHKKRNKVTKTCSVLRTRSWRSRSSPFAVRLHLLLHLAPLDAAPEAYEDGYADFLNAGGGTAGNRGGFEDTRVRTIAERLCGASASAAKAAAAATRHQVQQRGLFVDASIGLPLGV